MSLGIGLLVILAVAASVFIGTLWLVYKIDSTAGPDF